MTIILGDVVLVDIIIAAKDAGVSSCHSNLTLHIRMYTVLLVPQ